MCLRAKPSNTPEGDYCSAGALVSHQNQCFLLPPDLVPMHRITRVRRPSNSFALDDQRGVPRDRVCQECDESRARLRRGMACLDLPQHARQADSPQSCVRGGDRRRRLAHVVARGGCTRPRRGDALSLRDDDGLRRARAGEVDFMAEEAGNRRARAREIRRSSGGGAQIRGRPPHCARGVVALAAGVSALASRRVVIWRRCSAGPPRRTRSPKKFAIGAASLPLNASPPSSS